MLNACAKNRHLNPSSSAQETEWQSRYTEPLKQTGDNRRCALTTDAVSQEQQTKRSTYHRNNRLSTTEQPPVYHSDSITQETKLTKGRESDEDNETRRGKG
jgi:hypothetical protein